MARHRQPTDERDAYVPKHTPPTGVPDFVTEECTGRYEGEELRIRRSHRPTDKRVERLEERLDEQHARYDRLVRKIIGGLFALLTVAIGYLVGSCA